MGGRVLEHEAKNILNEGRAEGHTEGRIEGRAQEIVSMGIDFGMSKDDIITRMRTKLRIDLKQAEDYYNKYANETATV